MTAKSLPADALAVLDFWFGAEGSPEWGRTRDVWFRKDEAFDASIAHRFGPLVETALAGGLDGWASESESALARILLLDQFTRNIFRGSPRSFAGDPQALSAARAMVASRQDEALPPVLRSFVYVPFEHAEDIEAQHEAVRLITGLAQADPDLADMLDYAHRHRAIIERFGRFPHRNAVLGRATTADEAAFLLEPGSRF